MADEMYRILGDDFQFVATFPRNESELKGGIDYSQRSYCLLPAERDEDLAKAKRLIEESDVCVFGSGNLYWEHLRAKTGKLSFEISERLLKRGFINILSTRLLKWWWLYQTKLRSKPFYKLCAGAYTAIDCRRLLTMQNRCFKWGYFTEIKQSETVDISKPKSSKTKILWVARILKLKHPESMVALASYLMSRGYSDFEINMIGCGPEYENVQRKIKQHNLMNHIHLLGALPNSEVLKQMQQHDIFCFTSNRLEGWGAVVNEAMSCGCCVIANDMIGSVPYLIQDGKNGFVYRNGNIRQLCERVQFLLDNPGQIEILGRAAQKDMINIWNPKVAAVNLITLSNSIINDTEPSIKNGPCSIG